MIATFTTTKVGNSKDKVKVTIQYGYDYKELVKHDLNVLNNASADSVLLLAQSNGLQAEYNDAVDALDGVKHGRKGLRTSLEESLEEKNTTTKVYEKHPTIPGILVSIKTGEFYCEGLLIKEEILEKDPNPTIKKPVNSGIVVLIKNLIKKAHKDDLLTEKIRIYKIDNIDEWTTV